MRSIMWWCITSLGSSKQIVWNELCAAMRENCFATITTTEVFNNGNSLATCLTTILIWTSNGTGLFLNTILFRFKRNLDIFVHFLRRWLHYPIVILLHEIICPQFFMDVLNRNLYTYTNFVHSIVPKPLVDITPTNVSSNCAQNFGYRLYVWFFLCHNLIFQQNHHWRIHQFSAKMSVFI